MANATTVGFMKNDDAYTSFSYPGSNGTLTGGSNEPPV